MKKNWTQIFKENKGNEKKIGRFHEDKSFGNFLKKMCRMGQESPSHF